MKPSQSSKRHSLLAPISSVILLLFLGGYTYLWFKQARFLEERVHREINLLQANQETTFDHEGVKVTGFPWKLEIKIRKPCLTSTRRGSGILQIDDFLEVESAVWSPRTITVNAHGKTKFIYTPTPQQAPLMLEFEDLQGSFKIHPEGYTLKNIQFYELHLKMLKNRVNIEEFTLTALPPEKTINSTLTKPSLTTSQEQTVPTTNRSSSFALKIYRMKINDHTMTKFPSLVKSLDAIVHLEETFNLLAANPFKEWTDNGGAFEIEKFAFDWGSLKGEGNGTLAFDHDSQPLAAFSATFSGLETFLDQLTQAKIIRKNVSLIAKLSLGLLQDKSASRDETPRHTIALSLQKGDLSMGPLTIAKLPKLKWPQNKQN